ncbi:MAG: SusC/RagA family TonB-linked outer membrane protein, partial [Bacteroidota bacterium]
DQLQFNFIGYADKVVSVTGSTMNVVMNPDAAALDEVVVVAYGIAKKESFTGSATTVDVADLQLVNSDNITKSLEGLSSGVQITSGSGQPGESATIRIRGVGSVNASSDPLIVVDGFPFGGNINSIPSENIESMTVLKDAAAKSLYGSRAANGVIIITTKKGKAGTSNINFKAVVGVSDRAIPEYDVMGVSQYYETFWQRMFNENDDPEGGVDGAQYATDNLISQLGGYNAYNVPNGSVVGTDGKVNPSAALLWGDNWHDEAFQTGIRQEYDLSASGGTDKYQYYIGGNYLDSDGIVKASNFKRYSARVNVNAQVNNWFKVNFGANVSTSDQNFPNSEGTAYSNIFMWTRNIAPIFPVYQYELDGKPILDENGGKTFDYGAAAGRARPYGSNGNPLGTIALDTRWNKRDILSTRGGLEIAFLPELKLALNTSVDYNLVSSLVHQNRNFGDAASFNGRSTRDDGRNFTFNTNQILKYNKTLGSSNNIGVLAGHESYMFKYNMISATRTGFVVPGFVELDGATTPEGSSSYEDNVRMESYFGQVEYDYDSKYFVKASLRRDGSSRFHPDTRWGTFWSASASWRISEESFMEADWLNNLKLKASYGTSGNDRVGYYAYAELWSFKPNNSNNGLFIDRLATPELSWEKSGEFNVGLDGRMFDRLSFTLEYYSKDTYDLLFEKPLAPSSGNSTVDSNIGSLNNTGFEFEIAFDIFNGDFDWTIGVNGSMNKNKFTELSEPEGITVGSKRYEIGKSVYEFYLQDWAGVNPDTGEPQWWMNELDESGNETGNRVKTSDYGSADRYFVGSSLPDFRGGITSRMEFAGFDFTVLASYSMGGKVFDYSYAGLMDAADIGNNYHVDMANAWTPTNTNTDVPVLNSAISKDFNSRSTRFLRDASYFALNNVTLGYTLPKSVLSSIGVQGFRIYVTGDNLAISSSFRGLDPRQSISGMPGNNYTPIRTISGGLNINF